MTLTSLGVPLDVLRVCGEGFDTEKFDIGDPITIVGLPGGDRDR